MSPILFNVVVDAVIHHWLTLVVPTEEGMELLGLLIQDLEVYFYSNDGLVASTQPERLQSLFNVLTCLFDRVFLITNMQKAVIMAFQPCHAPGRMSV